MGAMAGQRDDLRFPWKNLARTEFSIRGFADNLWWGVYNFAAPYFFYGAVACFEGLFELMRGQIEL